MTDEDAGSTMSTGARLRRGAVPAILVVTAVFAAVAVVHTARRPWMPVGDEAATWFRSWDVGSAHTTLIGAHSRLGWHHPGPAMFYLFAPLIRLLGGTPSAMLVATLLVSLGSAVTLVMLAARVAGNRAALVLALGSAILGAGMGNWVIEPWNPFIAILPFGVFLVAAWLASGASSAAAVIACITGSFAVQCHLGALPPVALIGAAAGALRVFHPPPGARPGLFPRMAGLVALLLVLWAPPLLEQFTAKPGNITLMFNYFTHKGGDAPVGWVPGILMVGGRLLPWGGWIGHDELGYIGDTPQAPVWQLALSVALLLVAFALARRFRDDLALRLSVIEAIALVACAVALAQTRGPAFFYLVGWTRPVAMLVTLGPLVILARNVRVRARARWLPRHGLLAMSVALASVTISVRAYLAQVPLPFWSRLHRTVSALAVRAVPRHATVRVTAIGPSYTGSAESIGLALERAGRHGLFMPFYGFALGDHRTVPATVGMPTLVLATGIGIERLPHPELAKVLYAYDPLSAAERAEAMALRQKLTHRLQKLRREDLIGPLEDGAGWVGFVAPKGIGKGDLYRYIGLAAGEEKMPVALFLLPPTTW